MGFRRRWPGPSYGRGEDWHYVGEAGEPAFENDWENAPFGFYGSKLAFRIREAGIVDLIGTPVNTGNPPPGEVIFTLPEGYRPTARSFYPVTALDNSVPGNLVAALVTIDTDGSVALYQGTADPYPGAPASIAGLWLPGQFFLTPPDALT